MEAGGSHEQPFDVDRWMHPSIVGNDDAWVSLTKELETAIVSHSNVVFKDLAAGLESGRAGSDLKNYLLSKVLDADGVPKQEADARTQAILKEFFTVCDLALKAEVQGTGGALETADALFAILGEMAKADGLDPSSDPSLLVNASRSGNAFDVGVLLGVGADLNAEAEGGWTPLGAAIAAGSRDRASVLLLHEAGTDQPDGNGLSPIHHAMILPQSERHGMVRLLADAGADLNLTDPQGRTPLAIAAECRDFQLVRLLVEAGVDLNIPNNNGETALDFLVDSLSDDSIRHEVSAAVNLVGGSGGRQGMFLAVQDGDAERVATLAALGYSPNAVRTIPPLLAQGVDKGNADVVAALIAAGADPNAVEADGRTAWKRAVAQGSPSILKVFLEGSHRVDLDAAGRGNHSLLTLMAMQKASPDAIAVTGLLLARGVRPDRADPSGVTPIGAAALVGNMPALDEFLRVEGVSLTLGFSDGISPLSIAGALGRGDVVDALIASGAEVTTGTSESIGPLGCAALGVSTAAEVIDLFPNLTEDDLRGLEFPSSVESERVIPALIEGGADPNEGYLDEGVTPLMFAALRGNSSAVVTLLAAGADPTKEGTEPGASALTAAIMLNQQAVVPLLLDAVMDEGDRQRLATHALRAVSSRESLDLLLRAGGDLNAVGPDGMTPLIRFVAEGNDQVVEMLLSSGARTDLVDSEGKSPLHHATSDSMIGRLVAAGLDLDAVDSAGHTALESAFHEARPKTLGAMFRYRRKAGILSDSDNELNRRALANGKNLPMYIAALQGCDDRVRNERQFSMIQRAIELADDARFSELVEAGIDLNVQDRGGRTPLFHAVRAANKFKSGKNRIPVRKLLAAGADPNIGDRDGRYPLTSLATVSPIDVETMELLLMHGAATDVRDAAYSSLTALGLVKQNRCLNHGRAHQLLVAHGAQGAAGYALVALAHAWHLGGDSEIAGEDLTSYSVALSGSNSLGWLDLMAKNTAMMLQETVDPASRLILEQLGECLADGAQLREHTPESMKARLSSGKPVMIATGTYNHSVSFLKLGEHLIIGNRGEGFAGSAVEIYQITDVDRFADRLVNRIWSGREFGHRADLRGLHSELHRSFHLSRTDYSRAVQAACKLPAQTVGNCSWTSPEATVWAFMALRMTADMTADMTGRTAARADEDSELRLAPLLEAADALFNRWAEQNRLGTFENYLAEMARIGSKPDIERIEEIFEKAAVERIATYGYLAQGTEPLSQIRDRFAHLFDDAEPMS